MKILLAGFRDPNHSSAGGYDRIRTIKDDACLFLAENYPFGKKFKTHWMRIATSLMDIQVRFLCFKYDIVHFFYGELTCLPFKYLKRKRTKTIITLHLDASKREKRGLVKFLERFDGVIVLSSQQQRLLQQYGISSVFIPHGFDVPRYDVALSKDHKGNNIDKKYINVITIGSNYRDFDTLNKVLVNLSQINPRVRIHLVGIPKKWKELFINYPNVSIYGRLDDNEYYSLLSNCDYNFLPLTFATANNTLLEAQSLGIQSILPKIDGILDYGAPAPLNIYYDSFDELVKVFSAIEKNEPNSDIKTYSERFSWRRINDRILDFYKEICERK